MKTAIERIERRTRRKKHVRKNVSGTADRPRLTVFRSNKNIYAQLIDDDAASTLASASTMEKGIGLSGCASNKAAAAKVGEMIATRATEKGIKKVVFDRNGYPYHGRVQELADAARKAGLEF